MRVILQTLLMSPDLVLGGQAVMEGVMMKGKKHAVVSVRDHQGSIKRKTLLCKIRPTIQRIPILRGAITFFDMMILGIKALNWSAEQADDSEPTSNWVLGITLAVSFLLSIGLFVALPYFLTSLIPGVAEASRPILFNFIDGGIKLAILLSYLYLISRLKDINRLFQYHGAEHKAVHCYENKKALTVKNTKPFTTLHPRCGTSFILFVVFISIAVFSFIPSVLGTFLPLASMSSLTTKALFFLTRLTLLPLVAGLSYELLRAGARHSHTPFFKAIVAPGLWTQKITTKEPDTQQLEISLDALTQVIALEPSAQVL